MTYAPDVSTAPRERLVYFAERADLLAELGSGSSGSPTSKSSGLPRPSEMVSLGFHVTRARARIRTSRAPQVLVNRMRRALAAGARHHTPPTTDRTPVRYEVIPGA